MSKKVKPNVIELTLSDSFIRLHQKRTNSESMTSFCFDFSPLYGRITKMEPLQRYKSLETLTLTGHGFKYINIIGNLQKLIRLNLAWNAVSNISPLAQLQYLKVLNLSHNKICKIPISMKHLKHLKSLNISFNPIIDREEFLKLRDNVELQSLEIDEIPIMKDVETYHFVVFSLPQLQNLNRNKITREQKLVATEQFSNYTIHVPYLPSENHEDEQEEPDDFTLSQPSGIRILMDETSTRQLRLIKRVEDAERTKDQLRSEVETIKTTAMLAKTISTIKENRRLPTDITLLQAEVLKSRKETCEMEAQKSKIMEQLELEKMVTMKQKQTINYLKQRYQNERRSKEPRSPPKKSQTPTKNPHEGRLLYLEDRNKRNQSLISDLREESEYHISQIENLKNQVKALQGQLIGKPMDESISQLNSDDFNTLFSTKQQNDIIEHQQQQISRLQQENENIFLELQEKNDEIIDLKNKIDAKDQEIQGKSSINEELTIQIKEYEQIIQEGKQSSESIDKQQQAYIQEMNQKIDILKTQLNNSINELHQTKLCSQSKDQTIEDLQREIKKLKQKESNDTISLSYSRTVPKEENESNQKLIKLEKKISQMKKAMVQQVNSMNDQINSLTNEKSQLLTQIQDLEENLKDKESLKELVVNKEKQIIHLQSERSQLIAKIGNEIKVRDEKIVDLTQTLESTFVSVSQSMINSTEQPEYQEVVQDLNDTKLELDYQMKSQDLREAKSALMTTTSQLQKSQNESRMYARKAENQEKTIQRMQETLQAASKQTEELQVALTEKDAIISDLNTQIKLLNKSKKMNEKCMKAEIESQKDLIQQYENKLELNKSKYKSIKEKFNQQSIENSQLNNIQQEISEKNDIIDQLTHNNEQYQKQIERITTQIKDEINETKQVKASYLALQQEFQSIPVMFNIEITSADFKQISQSIKLHIEQQEKQIQQLKEKAQKKESKFNQTLSNLGLQLQKKNEQIRINEELINEKNKEIAELQAKLQQTVPKSSFRSLQQEKEKLNKAVLQQTTHIEDLSLQLSQLEETTNAELSNTQLTLNQREQELQDELESTKTNLSSKIYKLKQTKSELKDNNKQLSTQIEDLNTEVSSKAMEIQELKSRLENYESYKDDVVASIDHVEQETKIREITFRQALADTQQQLKASKFREQAAQKEIEELQSTITTLQERIEKLQTKVTDKEHEYTQLQLTLSVNNDTIHAIAASKDEESHKHQKMISKLKDEIYSLSEQLHESEFSRTSVQEKSSNELSKARRTIRKLTRHLSKLPPVIEQIDEEKSSISIALEDYKAQNKQLKDEFEKQTQQMKRYADMRNTTEHLFKTLTVKYNALLKDHEDLKEELRNEKESEEKYVNQIEEEHKARRKLQKQLDELKSINEKRISSVETTNLQIEQLQQIVESQKQEKGEALTKINELEKKNEQEEKQIQELNEALSQKVQNIEDLKTELIHLQSSTVTKTSNDELQQQFLSVVQAKGSVEVKLNTSLQENEILKQQKESLEQTIENLNQEIAQLKQQLVENSKEFKTKCEEFDQMSSQMDIDYTNQADTIKALRETKASLEAKIKQNNEEANKQKNELMAKMKNLQKNIDNLKAVVEAKEKETKDCNEKADALRKEWEAAQNGLNEERKAVELEKSQIENIKKEMQDKCDDLLREVSASKKSLRVCEEQNEKIKKEKENAEYEQKQMQDQLKDSVPNKIYIKLKNKYQEIKKLKQFGEQKLQNTTYGKTTEIENLQKEYNSQIEELNEKIRQMQQSLDKKKEHVHKLQKQVATLNEKLKIYDNPDSETCPKIELETCQKELKSTTDQYENSVKREKQNEKLISELKEVIGQLEPQVKAYSDLQTSLSNINQQILPIFNASMKNSEIISKLVSALNQLFGSASLRVIEAQPAGPKLSKKKTEILFSYEGDKSAQKLVSQIRTQLMSFKIHFDEDESAKTEDNLKQIIQMIGFVQKLFEEQDEQLVKMSEIVASQHDAVLKISDSPQNPQIIKQSQRNLQNSQKIIKKTRK